jgi:hypothetical protein
MPWGHVMKRVREGGASRTKVKTDSLHCAHSDALTCGPTLARKQSHQEHLARFEWFAPQVLAIKFDQVERAQDHVLVVAALRSFANTAGPVVQRITAMTELVRWRTSDPRCGEAAQVLF